MSDDSERGQAYLILGAIVAFAFIAYFVNNPYEIWSENASPFLALLIYWFASQPIYIGFLLLFTWQIYKEDESLGSAIRGFIAAVLAMIGLDIIGLPYAVMSITNVSQTLTLIANPLITPFADYQIISWIAGPSGIVTFGNDVFVHIGLPIILVVASYFIAKPDMFVSIIERS